MNAWLRFLFGLDDGEAPAGGLSHWELSGRPQGVWLGVAGAIVIAALVLIVLCYVRERGLGRWQRVVLSTLRLGALALVVLILLNPRLLTEIRLEHPGKTLLLFDVSASLAQEDELDGEEAEDVERVTGLDPSARPSRTEIGVAALERADVVARLREKNRVQLFTFGAELREVGAIASIDLVAPLAGETRLGDALLEAVDRAGNDPLAGIVVVTDGRSNGGTPTTEAARELAVRAGVTVHAVGLGKAQLPRNYAVNDLAAPPVVEVDTPVELEAKIRVSGLPGPVTVSLHRVRRGENTRTLVEARRLEVRGQLFETNLRFVDRLDRDGTWRYTVSFPRDDAEIEWRDNRRDADVTAAQEKRRVLLIAGQSTREFRYARNLALRDPGVQVSCWLASADPGYPQDGDVVIERLPASADELREYDVIALLDPDPKSLSEAFQAALVEFVSEQNGGLVYVAGEANTARIASEPQFRALRSLLPVDIARAPAPRGGEYTKEWHPALSPRGAVHAVCRLVDDPDENVAIWPRLPPFYWVFPADRLKPAGIELLRGDGAVLAAIQRVGIAEVLWLGSDDFWRWNAAGIEIHERFWGGVLRYLALGKLSSGTGKISVEVDRDQYREGDDIRVTAHLVDSQRRPIEQPRVAATIIRTVRDETARPAASTPAASTPAASTPAASRRETRGGGAAMDDVSAVEEFSGLALTPVAGSVGRYGGLLRASGAGQYEVRIGEDARAFFQVSGLSNEWDDPAPDFELLEQLARESHGRFYRIGEIGTLPDAIPQRKEVEILGRRASTVWDSMAMMVAFTALLVIEWVLRKLWRLN